jgi:hypothetical protein
MLTYEEGNGTKRESAENRNGGSPKEPGTYIENVFRDAHGLDTSMKNIICE